jgi:hypothetical protein
MSKELERVRRASCARRRADVAYRAALRDAWGRGASFADIARAAGVSRQTVREMVTSDPELHAFLTRRRGGR